MNHAEKVKVLEQEIINDADPNCVYFKFPSEFSKTIISYQNMLSDLSFCHSALIRLRDQKLDDVMAPCAFFSFVIIYGRCFTDASKSSYSRLDESVFVANSNLLQTHIKIMNLRHDYVAHRGNSEENLGIAYMIFNIQTLQPAAHGKSISRVTPDKEDYGSYLNLLEFLMHRLREKFVKASIKVWNRLRENYSDSKISEMIIAGSKKDGLRILKKIGKAIPQ